MTRSTIDSALSIIPDFSDGSVYSYSDDGSFFLRVGVTPEEYLDKFGDVNNACHLYFNSGDVNPANYDHRNRAFAVRLVTESK